jgi:purine nucleoside permease
MFERGADTGDQPGEFQYWVEREKLDQVLSFPHGYRALRMNQDGVLGVVTGVGTARAAASVMALGMDPRFDLTKAYWLVAGIAGIDPADGSIGSAVWAKWVVDGDLAREIDAREIPADWKTGYVPLSRSAPYQMPAPGQDLSQTFQLNGALVDWAFHLTEHVALPDTPAMQQERTQYRLPNARRAPFVLKGDEISASTFWSGALLDQWANDWVKYHTGGKGNYVTTAMEDSGTLQALSFLGKAGRVDPQRVLVLRTASDFDQPPPGRTPAQALANPDLGKFAGYLPSLEAAWRVGHVVVTEILKHWSLYQDHLPHY